MKSRVNKMSYLDSSLSFLRTCPVWGGCFSGGCFSPLIWGELSLLWVEDYPGRTKGKEWGSKTNEIRRWKKDYQTEHKQDRNWLKRWERESVYKTLQIISLQCCQFPVDRLGDKRLRIAITLLKQINFNIIKQQIQKRPEFYPIFRKDNPSFFLIRGFNDTWRRTACLSEISGKLKFRNSLLSC